MKSNCFGLLSAVLLVYLMVPMSTPSQLQAAPAPDLWTLARQSASTHRFSTLFTAQDVRRYLSSETNRQAAIAWCKQTGVTRVYLESFRDRHQAERTTLLKAKQAFRDAGLEVSGCVTPTQVGKASTGWKEVACCFTDRPTQEKLQAIFEFTAGLFDEIMVDDFWFTDCACADCDAARRARTVTVGDRTYPVEGDSWEAYRCELMVCLSRDRALGPARRVNPKVQLIIKYPQWYDSFQERGYDVVRETADFDRIWVGTETRDYDSPEWGGTPQYAAFFIMRWLGGIGGAKCGGGWYDWLGTTEATYLEQARQTILGGARESFLFAYGGLQGTTGPKNIQALRAHLPELLTVAREVSSRRITGIAAYKPPGSHPGTEGRVFDFVGMLGLPLNPCHEFPANAPAAFFSVHALKDPDLVPRLDAFISAGKPVLITDGLAQQLTNRMKLDAANVQILPVNQAPATLFQLDQKRLDALRAPLLVPFRTSFNAPNRVALYLFADGSRVVENFNDSAVQVELDKVKMAAPARGWVCRWK